MYKDIDLAGRCALVAAPGALESDTISRHEVENNSIDNSSESDREDFDPPERKKVSKKRIKKREDEINYALQQEAIDVTKIYIKLSKRIHSACV